MESLSAGDYIEACVGGVIIAWVTLVVLGCF